ncbi:MAG: hypothetical protein NT074_05415 [Methanomicrobiales archaeon]|jgi:hypothetical protein|nr:hypothetical protein [Methanomicrobiales archaeon]
MWKTYNLSPDLRLMIRKAEKMLGSEVNLSRKNDAPRQGILIDDYSYASGRNVIVFPSSILGMLKDYVIAENLQRLIFNGLASKAGKFRVLSFDVASASKAMEQIYYDTLKDENTRNMELWRKKKLLFYLYALFIETLAEIPWTLLSNFLIMKRVAVMRNAQVYFLIKESMRDMHELVTVKDYIPQRYFVMHNAMYYARDNVLAYLLEEHKLNPVINIPELQRFKNLDLKEMMTFRWSRSPWYHTKIVGDAMSNALKAEITLDPMKIAEPQDYLEVYETGVRITERWMGMMAMDKWYLWETPEHRQKAFASQDKIEAAARRELFAE